MTTIEIRLPFPPTVNGLFAGRTRRYLSKGYLAWRKEAELAILLARVRPIVVPVKVDIFLTAADRRRRDASNYIKAIEDSLVRMGVIQTDDARCVRQVSATWETAKRPGARVILTPL